MDKKTRKWLDDEVVGEKTEDTIDETLGYVMTHGKLASGIADVKREYGDHLSDTEAIRILSMQSKEIK